MSPDAAAVTSAMYHITVNNFIIRMQLRLWLSSGLYLVEVDFFLIGLRTKHYVTPYVNAGGLSK